MSQNIKKKNNKNKKESGPPLKRPEGASCSQRRAAFGTSSTTAKARTGAKLGPGAKANAKGAVAKAGATKTATQVKKVELQPPTNEELTKELQESIDCARAVLPNFKLDSGNKKTKVR